MTSNPSRRVLLSSLGAGAASLVLPLNSASASWLSEALRAAEKSSGKKIDLSKIRVGEAASFISRGDAVDGVKEALRVGTGRAVARVGKRDGYFLDKAIHINLPQSVQSAQRVLERVGLADLFDDLELRLNRAAESSAPKAKAIFVNTIRSMSIEDAVGIVKGPDDSATRYFQRQMDKPLRRAFRPVIVSEMNKTGAMRSFERIVARYSDIPLVPDLDRRARTQLVDHGLKYSLRGLFHWVGKEEAAIRNDPAKRTTRILRNVFGQ